MALTVDAAPLPKREDIPKEFWDAKNTYNDLASTWFFLGIPLAKITPKKPLTDEEFRVALRPIARLLDDRNPEHNHKIAAVAFHLSRIVAKWDKTPS